MGLDHSPDMTTMDLDLSLYMKEDLLIDRVQDHSLAMTIMDQDHSLAMTIMDLDHPLAMTIMALDHSLAMTTMDLGLSLVMTIWARQLILFPVICTGISWK